MLILMIFSLISSKPAAAGQPWPWRSLGVSVVIWILLTLLGWQVFGPPLHG